MIINNRNIIIDDSHLRKSVLNIIKTMTVWELKETTDALEKEFGLLFRAPEPVFVEEIEEVEEQTSFTVVLVDYDRENRMQMIKEIKNITGLGLKVARDLVETKNSKVKEDLNKNNAEELKARLESLGGIVEIR